MGLSTWILINGFLIKNEFFLIGEVIFFFFLVGDGIIVIEFKEKEAFSQQFPGLFRLFGDWVIVLVLLPN